MAMHDKLYIPKTITVGFQTRTDTFTGKLAYVIYTDHTGKLRKEASWNGWRDHKIATVTVDNSPQQGFTFNKGVKRDGYWGSGRSVIRVWDPRDFEFEISVDNLIGILMHADVSKRDITEPCVFAWNGTELILLPTNSLEYQESLKHTEKQGKKFSAKDLTPGFTYSLKEDRATRVVYLGRFPRYTIDNVTEDGDNSRYSSHYTRGRRQTLKGNKGHAFYIIDRKSIVIKDPSKYIDEVVSEEIYQEFASLIDTYYSSAESQPIVSLTVDSSLPADLSNQYYSWYTRDWFKWTDDVFVELSIGEYDDTITVNRLARFDEATKTCMTSHSGTTGNRYYYGSNVSAYNPTSVSPNDPALLAHVRQMAADYAALSVPRATKHQLRHEEQLRLKNEARGMLCRKYNVGELRFVLADGKIATDHNG